jgi:hypothetical protein
MLHFPELRSELELLGSGHNADPTKDEADALWTLLCVVSYSLASYVPFSIAMALLTAPGSSRGGSLCS